MSGGDHINKNVAGDTSPASSSKKPPSRSDTPMLSLTLWPNRSLPRNGFRAILAFTAFMLAIPLIPLLGTPVGLALLPFLVGTLLLLWFFIERNYRDGASLHEVVQLWPDLVTVARHDPGGQVRYWSANPYWVQTKLYSNAQIESYLTLCGNGREIEIGAFLSPEERVSLRSELDRALGDARTSRGPNI